VRQGALKDAIAADGNETAQAGYELLGYFNGGPAPSLAYSTADGISADGNVIVGSASEPRDVAMAFRWTKAGGMQSLGALGGVSRWQRRYGLVQRLRRKHPFCRLPRRPSWRSCHQLLLTNLSTAGVPRTLTNFRAALDRLLLNRFALANEDLESRVTSSRESRDGIKATVPRRSFALFR
jgi:probable HAF family extracellular repeat protein